MTSLDKLTASNRYEKFFEGVFSGKTLDKAAREAGFTTPARDAYPLLADPKTRASFRKKVRGRAETEGLSVAYHYLIEVIRNRELPPKTRLDAAKFVYSSVLPAPKAEQAPDGEKPANEMSNEELRQSIQQIEREISERATVVIDAVVEEMPAQTLESIL